MIKNYFITAIRNINKTKLYSLINVLGLAVGMTACLLIWHYVTYEKGFDRFHPNQDRIYRLRYERTDGLGKTVRFASCTPPAADRIRGSYPQVEKIGRIFRHRAVVSRDDLKFTEERMFFAEPEFFEVLTFPFISGDPVAGLRKPSQAFVSLSTAKKYFGDRSPLGETISVDKKSDYRIVGVFADIPHNSHLKMDIILPWKNLETEFGPEYTEAWGHTGAYTYLRTRPGVDPRAFETELQSLVKREVKWLKEYKMTIDLIMQPLTQIHLGSHFMQEFEVNGNRDTVNFLSIIALFILVLAWVNYINLSTARALNRAREVGLRKVVGASRSQLMIQFFLETAIVNFLAVILTLGLLQSAMPYFSQVTGLPPGLGIWTHAGFWALITLMFFAGILISGLYPVLALSSFRPVRVLKGKLGGSSGGMNLRKALVVFQFATALALMTATITVFQQVAHMRSRHLGFDIDRVLVIKAPRVREDSFADKFATFKNTLVGRADIRGISFVTEVPGRQIYWDNGGIRKAGEDKSRGKNYQIVGVDYDFADLFDLTFVAGRNFSREFPSDQNALVLNETAVKWMGFAGAEEAVGQQVDYWGKIYPIIGVLKDFHQQSPKEAFEPHIYRYLPHGRDIRGVFAVKIGSDHLPDTVEAVRRAYGLFFPGNPVEFFFLDDYFNQQYRADELLAKVFGLFAALAILVTTLGILGLSAYSAAQRIREIAIRKVLGASVKGILGLILKDFVLLLTLSFVLISPVAGLGLNHWLGGFAVRMKLGVPPFLMPYFFATVVTCATVLSVTVRAASINPVDTLKYE